MSEAWRILSALRTGEAVPRDLYVLDYRDGGRPRWTVHETRELDTGGRVLVLIDPDNGADDLFDDGSRVAVTVITHPNKTLRSQPHLLGDNCGNMLCDLDQQGRRLTRELEEALAQERAIEHAKRERRGGKGGKKRGKAR